LFETRLTFELLAVQKVPPLPEEIEFGLSGGSSKLPFRRSGAAYTRRGKAAAANASEQEATDKRRGLFIEDGLYGTP
jgi:hypothetical protein